MILSLFVLEVRKDLSLSEKFGMEIEIGIQVSHGANFKTIAYMCHNELPGVCGHWTFVDIERLYQVGWRL